MATYNQNVDVTNMTGVFAEVAPLYTKMSKKYEYMLRSTYEEFSQKLGVSEPELKCMVNMGLFSQEVMNSIIVNTRKIVYKAYASCTDVQMQRNLTVLAFVAPEVHTACVVALEEYEAKQKQHETVLLGPEYEHMDVELQETESLHMQDLATQEELKLNSDGENTNLLRKEEEVTPVKARGAFAKAPLRPVTLASFEPLTEAKMQFAKKSLFLSSAPMPAPLKKSIQCISGQSCVPVTTVLPKSLFQQAVEEVQEITFTLPPVSKPNMQLVPYPRKRLNKLHRTAPPVKPSPPMSHTLQTVSVVTDVGADRPQKRPLSTHTSDQQVLASSHASQKKDKRANKSDNILMLNRLLRLTNFTLRDMLNKGILDRDMYTSLMKLQTNAKKVTWFMGNVFPGINRTLFERYLEQRCVSFIKCLLYADDKAEEELGHSLGLDSELLTEHIYNILIKEKMKIADDILVTSQLLKNLRIAKFITRAEVLSINKMATVDRSQYLFEKLFAHGNMYFFTVFIGILTMVGSVERVAIGQLEAILDSTIV